MNFDITELLNDSHCRIIFTLHSTFTQAIRRAVIERDSEYNYGINEVFGSKKLGPFTLKNKKPIWKIISNGLEDRSLVDSYSKKIELYPYLDRFPATLSEKQMERASVLYNVLRGKTKFIIDDCETIFDDESKIESGFLVAKLLKDFGLPNGEYDFIWLTALNPNRVLEMVGDDIDSPIYSFYTIEHRELVKCDKAKLKEKYKDYQKEIKSETAKPVQKTNNGGMTPEQMYQEGRKYDWFSGFGLLQPTMIGLAPEGADEKEAFRWYKKAAEAGNLKAQNCVGIYYQSGRDGCEFDEKKALYWFCQAAFRKDYSTADEKTKESRECARDGVKDLMFRIPDGEATVRKYAGSEAQKFVEDAKRKKALEDWTKKDIANLDTSGLRDFMDRIH